MGDKREKVASRIQKRRAMMNFLYKLSGYADMKDGKEVFVETDEGPVRAICFGFDDPAPKPVFFDMHGGGFILMNAEADGEMCSRIAKEADCKVVSIDYALAPEHPFPKALSQVYGVAKAMHADYKKYGIDPNRMAIGGHSAGGNLATAACLMAADRAEFGFVCQVLDFPPLDLATSPFEKPCPKGAIKPKTAEEYDLCYVSADEQRRNPLVSPVYAREEDLAKLPPALIVLAGHDSLHDEGLRYAHLLEQAGVSVELRDLPGEKHGFVYFKSKATDPVVGTMVEFLARHFRKGDKE